MLRRLSITIVALMFCGIALANESNVSETANPLAGSSLVCSASAPSLVLACFWERAVFTAGSFEVALGVDARVPTRNLEELSVAPYAILAWYGPRAAYWLELAVPDVFPPVGRSDALRVGFSLRF